MFQFNVKFPIIIKKIKIEKFIQNAPIKNDGCKMDFILFET